MTLRENRVGPPEWRRWHGEEGRHKGREGMVGRLHWATARLYKFSKIKIISEHTMAVMVRAPATSGCSSGDEMEPCPLAPLTNRE